MDINDITPEDLAPSEMEETDSEWEEIDSDDFFEAAEMLGECLIALDTVLEHMAVVIPQHQRASVGRLLEEGREFLDRYGLLDHIREDTPALMEMLNNMDI
jgi:hypothetical protein